LKFGLGVSAFERRKPIQLEQRPLHFEDADFWHMWRWWR